MSSGRTSTRPEPAPGSVSEADSQDYSEAYTDELIERILENYEFKCQPELRFKLKHKLPQLALCACYSRPWHAQPRWRFTLKPVEHDRHVSKYVRSLLLVPETGQAAVFSSKININVFRLQFVLGYNWKQHTPSLDYRLTTKWGDGPRLKRKERAQVSDAFQLRAKWNMQAHFPDLEGHLGGSGSNGNTAVDVDYGGVSFEISQLDAVLEI
ncbi:hypothetical protein OEZ86_006307 [Tetradesmus obliquus]|uniref:DUF7781 domain-containing protein n=1 Tax=Tetradesmus obliquus TaxID=3088 RepID=A0A383W5N9_TETOB|nr:hypothetical protein OEZ86_006307 [Tetradesmus obliquus]|eukprot:jgi/Sobl393_1/10136/SZX79472.1